MLFDFKIHQKIFIITTCVMLVFFGVIISLPIGSPVLGLHEDTDFTQKWYYTDSTFEEGLSEKVTLPLPLWVKMDRSWARLSNVLPMDLTNGDCLYINLRNDRVTVYIDGTERQCISPEKQQGAFYNAPQNAWAIVKLSSEDAGKTVVLEYAMPRLISSSYIGKVLLGNDAACLNSVYTDNLSVFMGGVCTLFVSLFILVVGVLFTKDQERIKILSFLALYAFCYSIGKFQYGSQILMIIRNLNLGTWLFFGVMVLLCMSELAIFRLVYKNIELGETSDRITTGIFYLLLLMLPLCPLIAAYSSFDLIDAMVFLYILLIYLPWRYFYFGVKNKDKFKYPKPVLFVGLCAGVISVFDFLAFLMPCHYTLLGTVTAFVNFLAVLGAWIILLRDIYIGLEENVEIKGQLMDSKVQLMMSQIRPHFIYNALNSINILIPQDPAKAQKLVQQFSLYLRKNMKAMDDFSLIPFMDELEHIKAYVAIEQVRFPRIKVSYEIDETSFMVPVLSVEPLVENAIKHGVSQKREGGTVVIRAYRSRDNIYIEVRDNGTGFDVERLSDENSTSIGIKNIRYRLETLAGGNLSIKSEKNEGTTAVIKLPLASVGGNTNVAR